MLRSMLLCVAVAVATSSVCDAGGGSSKSGGTIRFTNTSPTETALVVVDPSAELQAATTLEEFTARGGRVVAPGKSVSFTRLKVGKRVVGTALVNEDTEELDGDMFDLSEVTVQRGKTVRINI